MAKLYCVSDIHGNFDALQEALSNAGFDPNDEDSWLIVCGDCFDRFEQPIEVMRYLMGLPRKILVKGNHEDLLVECCERGEAWGHDISNGTAGTIWQFGEGHQHSDFADCCIKTLARTHVFLDSMVDYFETKNYIFVHAWVPLICNDTFPPYYTKNRKFEKMDNWREANKHQWSDARWSNPFDLAERGLLPDKTLVFGHWHCSTGWAKTEGRSEFGSDAKFDPFYGDGFISIDSCVAHTGKINCIVLEDEFLITQN